MLATGTQSKEGETYKMPYPIQRTLPKCGGKTGTTDLTRNQSTTANTS